MNKKEAIKLLQHLDDCKLSHVPPKMDISSLGIDIPEIHSANQFNIFISGMQAILRHIFKIEVMQ